MRSELFTGRYLFHFHTSFTDGKLGIRDYFEYAYRAGIERLIFLEHIRSQPTYHVLQLARNVAACSALFALEAVIGFEAKLVPPGRLDISHEHLAMSEVVGIAEHSFPDDPELLRTTFVQAVNSLRSSFPNKAVVWVHPGLWFKKRGMVADTQPAFCAMVDYALSKGVFLEKNLRHGLISEALIKKTSRSHVVLGADAHRLSDLGAWSVASGTRQSGAGCASRQ